MPGLSPAVDRQPTRACDALFMLELWFRLDCVHLSSPAHEIDVCLKRSVCLVVVEITGYV